MGRIHANERLVVRVKDFVGWILLNIMFGGANSKIERVQNLLNHRVNAADQQSDGLRFAILEYEESIVMVKNQCNDSGRRYRVLEERMKNNENVVRNNLKQKSTSKEDLKSNGKKPMEPQVTAQKMGQVPNTSLEPSFMDVFSNPFIKWTSKLGMTETYSLIVMYKLESYGHANEGTKRYYIPGSHLDSE